MKGRMVKKTDMERNREEKKNLKQVTDVFRKLKNKNKKHVNRNICIYLPCLTE